MRIVQQLPEFGAAHRSELHLPFDCSETWDQVSRKSDTTFSQGTIPELSTSHIGKGVALVALAAAFVYIYARIPQIEEMTLSFHATDNHSS
jgi:hypothetical protein